MLNVLYINPNPPGGYNYYTDLYKRFRKMANCENGEPDVIVYGLNWLCKERNIPVPDDVPKICFVHKIGLDWERKEKFLKTCDVVLSSVPKLPIKHTLFRYGCDINIFRYNPTRPPEKVFDFGFSGALHNAEHYPKDTFPIPNLRNQIQELARTQSDLSLFLKGSDDVKNRIVSYESYFDTLCRSKIWMATTGPDGDIGPRYYEIMASGTLLFCDKPPDEYKRDFRDGENCVYFTPENFIEKLRFYLDDEPRRKKIITRAVCDSAKHTWTARAWELLDICIKLEKKKRNATL